MRRYGQIAAVAAALALSATTGARATAADPAAARVESLCDGVIDVVKQSKGAAVSARAHRIQPMIEQHFNFEVMAQVAIGEPWAKMSGAERANVVAALTRYTSARYAKEFDGQKCLVDPAVTTRGVDKLVKSQVVASDGDSPVNYRLREYGGTWKVIDVFYNGVSQLAVQRADFAQVLRTDGAPGLVAKLNALTAALH